MRPTLVLTACLLAGGCSGDASSSPSPNASAAASSTTAKVDLPSFCEKVCKRSTACGIEAAEKLAKGHAHELAVVEQLRKDAPKTEETCRDTCRSATVDFDEEADLAVANGCLEQTSCSTFEACLNAVDKPVGAAEGHPREGG